MTPNIRGGKGSVSVHLRGIREVQRAMRRHGKRANTALKGALFIEGEKIMAESKREVPVDTGVLRSTGHVQLPVEVAGTVVVTLGYGGPAAPYALRQHEELGYRHTVGKAKYLTDPADRAYRGMATRIARRIDSEMERGS